MTLLGHHSKGTEQQQEIREARRQLRERVRNDWFYPALPAYEPRRGHGLPPASSQQATSTSTDGEDEDKVAGFRFHTPSPQHNRTALGFEPQEWREREYSSGSDAELEGEGDIMQKATMLDPGNSAYRFDDPDSVGVQISDRRQARKRKRLDALQAEIGWNEGLAHWVARRDLWCGAHTAAQVQTFQNAQTSDQQDVTSTNTTSSPSQASTPRTSTSTSTSTSSANNSNLSSPTTLTPITQTHHQQPESSTSTTPDLTPTHLPSHDHYQQPTVPLTLPTHIPVTPPILPNHPVRRRMTPTTYSEIYNKIILQGRTPSVPINLRTLIASMVQGWKDDGEWPPKPSGPLEPMIAGKRKKSEGGAAGGGPGGGLKNGVKAVGRVLRLTGT